MKKLEFKTEWFPRVIGTRVEEYSCETAQRIFDQWYKENIESAPVVYGFLEKCSNWNAEWYVSESKDNYEARARLICIEPIPKKKCEHYPKFNSLGILELPLTCVHCGKEIRSKGGWEVV